MIVVSWNILADVFAMCRYYKNYTKCEYLEPELRYKKVIKRLKGYKADIIGLQEITENSVEKIKSAFSDKYHIVVGYHDKKHWKTDQHVQNGNLIMVKKTVGHIKKAVLSRLSPNGNRALFVHLTNGMLIVCFHLEDRLEKLRHDQLSAIMKKIEATKTTKGKSQVILMGDSNEPGTIIEEIVKDAGFRFNKTRCTNFEEYPMVIDYIFAHGFEKIWTHVPISQKTTILKNYGSDHLPVVSKII